MYQQQPQSQQQQHLQQNVSMLAANVVHQQLQQQQPQQGTSNGTIPHSNGIVTQYHQQAIPQQLTQYPINPDIRLKKLAFFDVLATLLKPSTLVPISTQRVQEGTYYFHLSAQQATELASNR